jgi:hypothetical protein
VNSIGIIFTDLGIRESVYNCIFSINRILKENKHKVDFTLFYENLAAPPIKPMCSSMNLVEAFQFPGVLVSTDINTTSKLLNMPAKKRVFYCYDAAEHQRANYSYTDLLNIYRAPGVLYLARSIDHANLLKNNWNMDNVGIMENFNLEALIEAPR